MKIWDISLTISPNLPTWPGDPKAVIERVSAISDGANANVSRMDMGVHTGTHVDAPLHFIDGSSAVEAMNLEVLIGPARVVQVADDVNVIDREVLEKLELPAGTTRVLFKTRNSKYWASQVRDFQTDFVGIDESGSKYLVEKGVRLVGVDYLSVAPYKQSRPTHQVLLGANMVIVEGVDLSAVQPGEYQLICLPLKIEGSDGAPARAVLIQE
ncbi:cyclase family protein [Bellilinea sp.]|uniref:cyclase family protein n=1 Tax=Bellilinea sp. TaxID=2838785 RepID=UPI002ADE1295|nr:cyclase family protein [Bellilinea sp.]